MATPGARETRLPLDGIRVVEFSQMVMGPACGMLLGDLGADVIKVEPLPKGDRTRDLKGIGVGFFAGYNRNKRSLALDMKAPGTRATLDRLIAGADVMIENFRPGGIERLGYGYDRVARLNPRLIYCTLKGFMPGPYAGRAALDEVAQMMAGLAYMTGLPGKPMRAGASVNDVMGAMFAVIGIQAALAERARTGKGQAVQSALFETCAFLVSPFALTEAIEGRVCPPMSQRRSSWPVYDLFETKDGKQVFLAVVGDEQWADFCAFLGKPDWLARADLQTMNQRTERRDWLVPAVAAEIARFTYDEVAAACEAKAIGFAPVNRPYDLLADPHLAASGGLVETVLPDGRAGVIPGLPVSLAGRRFATRRPPPKLGEHNAEILAELGIATT